MLFFPHSTSQPRPIILLCKSCDLADTSVAMVTADPDGLLTSFLAQRKWTIFKSLAGHGRPLMPSSEVSFTFLDTEDMNSPWLKLFTKLPDEYVCTKNTTMGYTPGQKNLVNNTTPNSFFSVSSLLICDLEEPLCSPLVATVPLCIKK